MRRVVRWSGSTFIVAGITILLFAVYELVGTSIVNSGHQRALAEEFRESLSEPVVTASPSPGATATATPGPRKVRPRPPAIARIIIRKAGVDEIVVEGVKLSQLAYGPGHYPTSADIGGRGVSAIAGHRTGWGSPFINLDRLARGDEVVLMTKEATYTYKVTGTIVVDPDQTWVLGGDPKSQADHKLVLTTCTPKYTSKRRLVIWLDLAATVKRVAPS